MEHRSKNFSEFERKLIGEHVYSVLFVAEADFSFSATLLKRLLANACHVPLLVPTTLETESQVLQVYASGRKHVELLRLHGAAPLFGFDAHSITNCLEIESINEEEFCRIVCNLPCIGNDTHCKQRAMRVWLYKFLLSAKSVLTRGTGQIWLTLLSGQADWHQWQLEEQLNSTGLILQSTLNFPGLCLPGYNPRRGPGRDSSFPVLGARTYVIVNIPTSPITPPPLNPPRASSIPGISVEQASRIQSSQTQPSQKVTGLQSEQIPFMLCIGEHVLRRKTGQASDMSSDSHLTPTVFLSPSSQNMEEDSQCVEKQDFGNVGFRNCCYYH